MADINEILHTIASAIYGKDVRQGIYDAIDFIHNEYLTIKTVAEQMHTLIGMYEGYVKQAQELTGKLDEQITTGTGLKEDLSDLNSALSDGRQVLAELKTENGKATAALEEAREKIPILQDLLSRIPDLDEAERITGGLETAYNDASQALEELNGLSGTLDTLTAQNELALQNLSEYESAKSDIDALVQKTNELQETITNYPEIIQALETAYQNVIEKTVDLDQLNNLLNEIDENVQIINENKESINTVAQGMDIIKQFIELGGVDLSQFEQRLSAVESTLNGLEETLERLI